MVRRKRKLALATNTVRALTTEDLENVAGGNRGPRNNQSQCTYDYSGCIRN